VPRFSHLAALALASFVPVLGHAQTAQQIIQQIVDTERTENKNDRSQWIYLDNS
jgi:hypothetical protein